MHDAVRVAQQVAEEHLKRLNLQADALAAPEEREQRLV